MDKVLKIGNGLMAFAIAVFAVTMLLAGGLSTFALIFTIILAIGAVLVTLFHVYKGGVWLYDKVKENEDNEEIDTRKGEAYQAA